MNKLIEKNLPFLTKFAFKLTKNASDAHDLVNDTVLRALEKQHLFDGSNFSGWSGKIMYNLFVSRYRRRIKFESQFDPEVALLRLTSASNQEEYTRARRASAMVSAAPAHFRDVLTLHAMGFEYELMATMLKIPVGTVRSRLARARTWIREREELQVAIKTGTGR